MTKLPEILHCLTIEANAHLAAALDELLSDSNLPVATWSEEDRDVSRVELYLDSREEADRCRRELEHRLRRIGSDRRWRLSVRAMPRQNWAEGWKRFFHAQRVSARIVVCPSWEPYAAQQDDCVIRIDPGMGFGTGQHATTRACLQFLDIMSREGACGTVLDLGCGSGILAIAAAKLGFGPVTAMDCDLPVVAIARTNCALNGVAGCVACLHADLRAWPSPDTYDTVLANLEAGLLVECADTLAASVSKDGRGRLALAGILSPQFLRVRDRFAQRGFREIQRITENSWTTGLFRRS